MQGENKMRTSTDFIGKPIISVDNGINLGTVKDLYFDQGLEKLAGIFLKSEGLIKRKAHFIDARNIVLLGQDAVLVDRSDAIQDSDSSNAHRDWVRRERVAGRAIKTSGGTLIGSIGDLYLNAAGEIRALLLTKIQIESPVATVGLIARDAVLDPGDDDIPVIVDLAKAEQHSSEALQAVKDA
jgi:uncharacterized protein YrrD